MNNGISYFKPIAGIYIFWQGMTLLSGLQDGESSMGVPLTIILGVFFLAFGVWCVVSFYRSYMKYKKEQEAEMLAQKEELSKIPEAVEDAQEVNDAEE